jgi:signal transduction histidine kinase
MNSSFKYKIFLIYFVVVAVSLLILNGLKEKSYNSFLDSVTREYVNSYQSVYQHFNHLSRVIYISLMEKSSFLSIYEQIDQSAQPLNVLRDALKADLFQYYQKLKVSSQLRQLHFHLKDNISFLRLHRPDKFGDDLSDFRATVKYVNHTGNPIDGFEEGRIYNGFRFVFPINSEGRHLGSFEISFSADAFVYRLIQHFDIDISFYIKSSIVDDKLFPNEKSNYQQSIFEKYYEDVNVVELLREISPQSQQLSQSIKNQIAVLINHHRPFSLFDDSMNKLITNIPIVNPITSEVAAFFLIKSNGEQYLELQRQYLLYFLLIQMLILFLFWSIYLLLSKKNQFRSMLDSQHSILIISNGQTIIDCNQKFLHLTGFASLHDFNNKYDCLCDILISDEHKNYISKEQWLRDKPYLSNEYCKMQLLDKYNNNRIFQFNSHQFSSEEYLFTLNDITTLERTHSELEHINQSFIRAQQIAQLGSWELDHVQHKLQWSNQVYKIFDVNPDHFIPSYQLYLELLHPDDKSLVKTAFENAIKNQKSYDHVHRIVVGNNQLSRIKWIKEQCDTTFDIDGHPILSTGIIHDVTLLKKKSEELDMINDNLKKIVKDQINELRHKDSLLQQQSKMALMGEMIGAIAHQWRQPLNALNINIQNLDDDFEDGLIDQNFIEDFIQRNHDTIAFMSDTIDDFRNFFRLDKTKENFSVMDSINTTHRILANQLSHHHIDLNISGLDFQIHGYKNEFQQVLLNIINNARDALLEKQINFPTIRINLKEESTYNLIIIEDNAGGIDAGIIERVFEPYFTTKDEGKGTGLGLYMCKMMIEENMQGKLMVENISGDNDMIPGARFTIRFNH